MVRIMSSLRGDGSCLKRQSSAKSSRGSCRFFAAAEEVNKLKKEEELMNTKENGRKRALSRNNGSLSRNDCTLSRNSRSLCSSKSGLSRNTSHQSYRGAFNLKENNDTVGRDINSHCQCRLNFRDNGTKYQCQSSDAKFCCQKERLPSSRARSSVLTENSTLVQSKAVKTPFMNSSLSKMDASESILAKTKKQRVSRLSADSCSIPSSLTDSTVVNGDHEFDLISSISSGMCEQELLDLDLLPDGLLPEKRIITYFSTPEKSITVTSGEFLSFDGSKVSPIEEASLVLNRPRDKEAETTSEGIDSFESLHSLEMLENVSTEMLQIQDGNVDSKLALQFNCPQYCPWSEDVKSTSDEWALDCRFTLEGSSCTGSSFNCSSFKILPKHSDMCNCMAEMHYLSQYQEYDSILSSVEHDLVRRLSGMSLEANKIADQLVASATQSSENSSCASFSEERSSSFTLEESLTQWDELISCSNQELLFWPLTPNSCMYDEDNLEHSTNKMDFEAEETMLLLKKSTHSPLCCDWHLSNFPELQTGCFEICEDPIEILVGMKEFDGHEGLEGLKNESRYSLCVSDDGEKSYSNVDCASSGHELVQKVSVCAKVERPGESMKLQFQRNCLESDTSLDLSTSSEAETSSSSSSSLVRPQATSFAFGNSSVFQELEGGQAVRLEECWLQDDELKCNNKEDSGAVEKLYSCMNFDCRCNGRLPIVNLKKSMINSMNEEYLPASSCLEGGLEKGSSQTDTCQICSIQSSKSESGSNNVRHKMYLLEQEKGIEGDEREVVCAPGLTIRSSGNDMSGQNRLYYPEFQGSKITPTYKSTPDSSSIGHEDGNFVTGDKFKRKTKEAIFSGLSDEAQCNLKSSQENSPCILNESIHGTEAEEIKIVTHIHNVDNPESEGVIVGRLHLPLQPGKKTKSFEYNTQGVKSLAALGKAGVEKKVELLETELLEVKRQNQKLASLLKCVLRRTNIMQQSWQERKRCWHRRRHVVCQFSLHLRRKRNKHQGEILDFQSSSCEFYSSKETAMQKKNCS